MSGTKKGVDPDVFIDVVTGSGPLVLRDVPYVIRLVQRSDAHLWFAVCELGLPRVCATARVSVTLLRNAYSADDVVSIIYDMLDQVVTNLKARDRR